MDGWKERLKAEYAELKERYEMLRAHNICHNFSKEQLECGFYYGNTAQCRQAVFVRCCIK